MIIIRKTFIALLTLVLFAVLFSHTTSGAASSFDGAGVDQYMRNAMERLNIPGASLGIVKGDRIIYLQGYGISGPEQKPITPQTPFILGSTSKSITALAVIQLAEEGRVELEAPVQRYLPWFHLADAEASARITVQDLLHQTSGISEYEGRATMASDDLPLEDYLRGMTGVPLAQPVGAKYQYSNLNYDILGGIIQEVSQQPYGDYVKDHIFKPLDMEHSTAYVEEAQEYGLASGYQPVFGIMMSTPRIDHTASVPDGNLISSAEDLSKYLIAQMNGGHFEDQRVLSKAGMDRMHQPASLIKQGEYYGMGWIISDETVWHNGTTESSSSYLSMDGEYGIVLLFNSVDFLASYDYILQGIGEVLHGQVATVDKLPHYNKIHMTINAVLLLFVILYVWSLYGLIKWKNTKQLTKPRRYIRSMTLLLLNIVLPIAVLIGIPMLLLPWPVALLFLPGIAHFILIFCLLLIAAGVVKIVRIGRDRRSF
ncbi:serine hydrolase domain-containing protein [Paenibacillus sp. FSL L8-0436]|uniref:serine hydrolase domain-containing protein n=1 Tax=Paenibacillus sp. FSL L8-0436 TaxID=2954686 RepID=UPI003158DC9D